MLRTLTAFIALAFAQSVVDPNALIQSLPKMRLDPQQVYSIRDITIHRDVLSISFDSGVIAFLEPVNGRVTGAAFIGEGEIVAIPPDSAEKQQLARYTQSPLLNHRFAGAFFRFTDNTYAEIMKAYQEHAHEDVDDADRVRVLALNDEWARRSGGFSQRVLLDVLGRQDRPAFVADLQSDRLGWFTASYDERAAEEVTIGNGGAVWTSFNRRGKTHEDKPIVDVISYQIDATIAADMSVSAKASVQVRSASEGDRVLGFMLAPSLRVDSVVAGGQPLSFSRVGNRVSVVLSEALKPQQEASVQITFAGDVIEGFSGASPGVSRPFWYPAPDRDDGARYDLTIRFPAALNVFATGQKMMEREASPGQRVATWVTDSDALDAGFAVSRCAVQAKESGTISLATCIPSDPSSMLREVFGFSSPALPSRPIDFQAVGQAMLEQTASLANFFEKSFGALPHKKLQISTLPSVGVRSSPSLVYLPLLPALNKEQRELAGLNAVDLSAIEYVFAREIARQWFGHTVTAKTYRDRWIIDGLAAYAAAMYVETKSETALQQILARARTQLLEKSPEGVAYGELASVSLGPRLTQPRSTEAYLNALENKSVWIMHSLRMRMRDAGDDSRFLNMVRELTAEYRAKPIMTADFKRLAEKHAGETLDSFFDEWVFASRLPAF